MGGARGVINSFDPTAQLNQDTYPGIQPGGSLVIINYSSYILQVSGDNISAPFIEVPPNYKHVMRATADIMHISIAAGPQVSNLLPSLNRVTIEAHDPGENFVDTSHPLSLSSSSLVTSSIFNIVTYGADPTGVKDSTSAFLNAVSAASVKGGVVLIPSGTFKTSQCISVNTPGVSVVGIGQDASIVKPISGANFDVFSTGNIPYGLANSANDVRDIVFRDFSIDGSNMTGTSPGQGNGIHFWGARQSFAQCIHFYKMPNYCIVMEGSTNGGYNDFVINCQMDSDCAGGIWMGGGNEANWAIDNIIIGCAQNLAAPQPAFFTSTTLGHLINSQAGISNIYGNVFGGGSNTGTMNSAVLLSNEGHRFIGNRFDGTMNTSLDIQGSGGNAGMMIIGNEFKDAGTVVSAPSVSVDASECTFIGNVWIPDSPPHYTYCIKETAPLSNNLYSYNIFRSPGTVGTFLQNPGSTGCATHNVGYNPLGGGVTQPPVPASGTPVINKTGVDCMVIISTLGTLTSISIGGTAVTAAPAVGSTYRILAGESITPVYAGAAPTWQWFGD